MIDLLNSSVPSEVLIYFKKSDIAAVCFNKKINFSEQKVIQYEQYVRDMQMYNQASGNGQEISDGVTFQELQQEVTLFVVLNL